MSFDAENKASKILSQTSAQAVNARKNGVGTAVWKKRGKLQYLTYEKATEGKIKLETGNDIVWELMNGKYKIEINEVERAVKALDKAKANREFCSLYWILYKLVNGNG